MLLRAYKYRAMLPECNPSAETVNALAVLSDDVREVLPYLNAAVPGAVYDHAAGTLRFKHQGKAITIYPRRVAISNLKDEDEARATLEWLKETLNRLYEKRKDLAPSYRRGRELKPLEVYKLLPRTNCGVCGEPACLAFAAKLVAQEVAVGQCAPLFTEEHRARREELMVALRAAGYEVPAAYP